MMGAAQHYRETGRIMVRKSKATGMTLKAWEYVAQNKATAKTSSTSPATGASSTHQRLGQPQCNSRDQTDQQHRHEHDRDERKRAPDDIAAGCRARCS